MLTSSLLIIKQGKYRKLIDEIDDLDFDDVVQQCLFLFLFMPQKFVHKHVHTIVLPFGRSLTSLTHSLNFLNIITYQHSYFFGTQVHMP